MSILYGTYPLLYWSFDIFCEPFEFTFECFSLLRENIYVLLHISRQLRKYLVIVFAKLNQRLSRNVLMAKKLHITRTLNL